VARRSSIAPIFPVRDLEAALAYYSMLGFTTRAYDGGGYGFARRGRVEIHPGVVPDSDQRRGDAYLFVEDADELAAEWRAAGAEVHGPEDTEWRQHEGAISDPDGNVIRFGSPIRH
jgi:predicted enzyme related to lactoylglutathione lyase